MATYLAKGLSYERVKQCNWLIKIGSIAICDTRSNKLTLTKSCASFKTKMNDCS